MASEVARAALVRIAQGLPAFEYEPYSPEQLAERREAIQWLKRQGLITIDDSGDRLRVSYRASQTQLKPLLRPYVTERGCEWLKNWR